MYSLTSDSLCYEQAFSITSSWWDSGSFHLIQQSQPNRPCSHYQNRISTMNRKKNLPYRRKLDGTCNTSLHLKNPQRRMKDHKMLSRNERRNKADFCLCDFLSLPLWLFVGLPHVFCLTSIVHLSSLPGCIVTVCLVEGTSENYSALLRSCSDLRSHDKGGTHTHTHTHSHMIFQQQRFCSK